MKIETMFENYLNYVKDYKSNGYYEFTLTNVKVISKYFFKYKIFDTKHITYDNIYNFFKLLRKNGNCNNSLKKKLDVIKRSLVFNDIHIDLSKIKIGQIKTKPFKYFNEQQLKIIVEYYFNLDLKNPVNFTKYIAVLILLHTGIRRTELTKIKINHINLKEKYIYLDETKTKNDRYILFRDYMVKDLKKYIALKKRKYLLWDFKTDSAMTPRQVSDFMKYDKNKMSLKYYSAHMFRHTFATMMVQNGSVLPIVQQLLGHESIKSTQIYLHLNDQFIKEDYEKHSIKLK